MLQDFALGMNYLHLMQIIHGNLGLDNLLLSPDGFVKVTDFGIGKLMRHAPLDIVSPFLAPERLTSKYSFSADIWSYALIASVIVRVNRVGGVEVKASLDGEEVEYLVSLGLTRESRAEIQKKKQCALQNIPESMEGLYSILDSCLHVIPEKRPNFSDVLYDLQGIVEDENLLLYRSQGEKILKTFK